ncbi:Hypp9637 [Branchiostoma lanceolatum]|uniref:Hypp9637 protein n=1 Tax=Branchiostoma lanceolatum TaxID=7740 RepID=A0A8S4MNG5_BRALA|nr:Hypp9637 [Branchiostoma lanceolatum]
MFPGQDQAEGNRVLHNRMVVIPTHTADCERALFCLKRVKTRLRSKLTAENPNHLLMVRIEEPDLSEFNFDEAVEV